MMTATATQHNIVTRVRFCSERKVLSKLSRHDIQPVETHTIRRRLLPRLPANNAFITLGRKVELVTRMPLALGLRPQSEAELATRNTVATCES